MDAEAPALRRELEARFGANAVAYVTRRTKAAELRGLIALWERVAAAAVKYGSAARADCSVDPSTGL